MYIYIFLGNSSIFYRLNLWLNPPGNSLLNLATTWQPGDLARRTCACPWTKLRSRPSPMVALEMPTSNAARPGQGSDLGIQIL